MTEEEQKQILREAFSSSRVSIFWDNKLILGASFDKRKRPENSKELHQLLLDLVAISEISDEEDAEILNDKEI
jgi:hypothetical protein